MTQRITLKRGREKRICVLTSPPYPRKGDLISDGDGHSSRDWTVTKVEATEIIGTLPIAKATQVFPPLKPCPECRANGSCASHGGAK